MSSLALVDIIPKGSIFAPGGFAPLEDTPFVGSGGGPQSTRWPVSTTRH